MAKAEKEQNGEITAALIENKAGLEPDEQFYGVHLIDDTITTVEEAREAILALYNKRREKQ